LLCRWQSGILGVRNSEIHESSIRMNHIGKGTDDDVRMRGFAKRHTVNEAIAWLDAQLHALAAEQPYLQQQWRPELQDCGGDSHR